MADRLPLSKTLDPDHDYPALAPELAIVDQYFTTEREQHPHRRFEYALALRAWAQHPPGDPVSIVYDVGGAGSPFRRMIGGPPGPVLCSVVDPDSADGRSLAETLTTHPPLADAVFCLSVLEHIPTAQYDQFLYHLTCLLAPGGLLFLTFDFWDGGDVDTAHFHWMRERIFTRRQWTGLLETFADLHCRLFGAIDLVYHGAHVYGSYSFASLALIKRG